MPLQISSLSADFKTRASSPYIVFECEGVRAQTKAIKNSTSWDEIIILPGQFRDGCELVVAAYNHNAILADDLIGSGGTDLRGLHGAAGAAGSHARRIQLFDKNDEPAGTLMLDVISVDKEVAGGAPAVGAPVAAGLGAAREGGGISPAAAPTTPGAQGEVRRTPSGPSAVEAERERLQRARETTTAATGEGAAASPEGEGVIEKIKRATGIGAQAAREPSPERRPALAAAAAPVSAAPISTPTRTVPAPRHRELEGEHRATAAATSGLEGKMSRFGRVIEGPEGGQVVERKVLTRMGERVAEIERVQRVTTRTPVESNFVVEVRLLSQRELPQEARTEEGNITERVIRVQEPETPEAVAPSLKFEGEARGMRQQAARSEAATGGGGGGTISSSSGGGGGGGGSTAAERFREGQARGGAGEGLMETAGLRGGGMRGSSAAPPASSEMGPGAQQGMGQGQGKLPASQARSEEGRGRFGATRAEA